MSDIFSCRHLGVVALGTADAFSLFSLASNNAERLHGENTQAYELFIKKLAMVGMFLDGSYDDTFYLANKFKGFRIQNEFPKITPNDVKVGITKAKYAINLGACADYETPLEEVFKCHQRVFGLYQKASRSVGRYQSKTWGTASLRFHLVGMKGFEPSTP